MSSKKLRSRLMTGMVRESTYKKLQKEDFHLLSKDNFSNIKELANFLEDESGVINPVLKKSLIVLTGNDLSQLMKLGNYSVALKKFDFVGDTYELNHPSGVRLQYQYKLLRKDPALGDFHNKHSLYLFTVKYGFDSGMDLLDWKREVIKQINEITKLKDPDSRWMYLQHLEAEANEFKDEDWDTWGVKGRFAKERVKIKRDIRKQIDMYFEE